MQAALLVLDVRRAGPCRWRTAPSCRPAPSPLVSVYFQTSSAFDSFARIAFGAERHHEAREHHVVDEDACASRTCRRCRLSSCTEMRPIGSSVAAAVGVLHVAAQLEDEHPAVAVEGNLRRLLDVRLGEHRLELEAGRQPEPLGLLLGGQRQHRRLLREVRLGHQLAAASSGSGRRAHRRALLGRPVAGPGALVAPGLPPALRAAAAPGPVPAGRHGGEEQNQRSAGQRDMSTHGCPLRAAAG